MVIVRHRLALVVALLVNATLAGCQPDTVLPHPAVGPPGLDPPHPIRETMQVGEDKATDTRNHMTGVCVSLYLWSETDAEPEWRFVAQGMATTAVGPQAT